MKPLCSGARRDREYSLSFSMDMEVEVTGTRDAGGVWADLKLFVRGVEVPHTQRDEDWMMDSLEESWGDDGPEHDSAFAVSP